MANVLAFYTAIGGGSSLDISSYVESGTHIPLPPHTKIWSGNITSEGSNYVDGKYENIPITLALKIEGASKTDLDDDLRAVIAEITKENWLYFEPEGVGAGNGLYYHTFPYDSAEAQTYLSKAYRDAFTVYPFTITLMAEPYAYQAEAIITVVENLCPNWNMEDFTGDDPDDWTVTEVGAGDSVTQETGAGDFLFGSSSVDLTSTTTFEYAQITTTAYIAIDPTKHYCLVFNYRQETGSATQLVCAIEQYSAAPALLETTSFNPTVPNVNNWYSYTVVIHPAGEGGNDWNAAATQCKIYFRVSGVTGGDAEKFYIDGIVFTPSENLSGNTLSNPLGIVLPPADISGDAPTPCDIYMNKLDDTVLDTQGIYIGGREEYDAGYVPYLESDSGTVAYSSYANQGSYRSIDVASDGVLNGGFEAWTVSASNPTFTSWTITAEPGLIEASTNSKFGDWALKSYSDNQTSTETNEIETTAYIPVVAANDYIFSFWYRLNQATGFGKLLPKVRCYTAVPALSGTLYPLTSAGTKIERHGWARCEFEIAAADWPAGPTTQIKIEFEMSGRYNWRSEHGVYDEIYLDGVRFYQSSLPHAVTGAFDLDDIRGVVKPWFHGKLTAALDTLAPTLLGKLTDGANDITPFEELVSSESWALPAEWKYEDMGLDPFEFPNARLSDNADTAGIDQSVQMNIYDLTAASTPILIDSIALLPIDNGYAAIPAEANQYLIVDSQSQMPGVLTASDNEAGEVYGDIDKAAWYSPASMSRRFTLDPQNGSNLAILERYTDSSDNEYGQFLMEVTIKYKPRFLLAP